MNAASPTDTGDAPPSQEWLESKFIEQEHRLLQAISNYLEHRHRPPDDPRRKASRRALLWRVLSPGTVAVTSGGIIAIATLGFMAYQSSLLATQTTSLAEQTALLGQQNEYLRDQNQKLQKQIETAEDVDARQRKTELLRLTFDPSLTNGIRAESLEELLRSREILAANRESQCAQDDGTDCSDYYTWLDLSELKLQFTLRKLDSNRLRINRARLDESEFYDVNLHEVTANEASFANARFGNANLSNVDGRGTSFAGAHFGGSTIESAFISSADFSGATFDETSVKSSVFEGCRLEKATIAPGSGVPSFAGTVFRGCSGQSADFVKVASELGATFEPARAVEAKR